MIYALDTNIIPYILRGDKGVTMRWRQEETLGNISVIPLIVYYEIKRGLISANATVKLAAFENVCKVLNIDDMTISDIDVAARIYAERKMCGRPIEDADLLIAAQCIANNYTLVTNNTRHFDGIENLNLINWVE